MSKIIFPAVLVLLVFGVIFWVGTDLHEEVPNRGSQLSDGSGADVPGRLENEDDAVALPKGNDSANMEPVPVVSKPDPGINDQAAAEASVPVQTKIDAPVMAAAVPDIAYMEKSGDPVLNKVAQYENCCNSAFTKVLIFTATPTTESEAVELAKELALRLQEISRAGIAPIVTAEPLNIEGAPLSFKRIAQGEYDKVLRKFFMELRAGGITDKQMGTWIPLPESNLDEWGKDNVGPDIFGPAYNRYAAILKEYFGGAKITLLLDNETYNPKTGEKELISLLPWTAVVDKRYVDSFGLQGYPWVAPANEGNEKDFDAASFLNAGRAVEAAKSLGVKDIWFSTGTIAQMFSGSKKTVVNIASSERAKMLEGILSQAKIARAAGYSVMVCIFAEDRRNTEEETDFSYWGKNGDIAGDDAQVFKNFVSAATTNHVPLAVYDSM